MQDVVEAMRVVPPKLTQLYTQARREHVISAACALYFEQCMRSPEKYTSVKCFTAGVKNNFKEFWNDYIEIDYFSLYFLKVMCKEAQILISLWPVVSCSVLAALGLQH